MYQISAFYLVWLSRETGQRERAENRILVKN